MSKETPQSTLEHSLDDLAVAESTWQKALSAAGLQLALATEAAGQDAQALAAAQTAYDSSLAAADLAYQQSAADAQGDAAIANAQATDDYVDEVYGQAGDYETWKDALDSAENTYDLARSAAEETRDKNIAALDAALEAALADTYADALEQLALDHPSPWSARAADARAESNKTSSEQTARTTFDNSIFTATADFQDAVAGADLLKSDTQTGALGTYQQAQSQAALAKATAQAADNNQAATAGVGTQHKPDEKEIPDAPEDLVTESLGEGESGGLGTMPLLDPAESAALIDGQNGFCTTLDLGICFAAGTPVVLADGTTKPIEQIQPGDQVLSAPEDDAEATPTAKAVERVFHNPPSELIRLTIAGQELRCTPPHLFYVKEKGWTAAQDLQIGDHLRTPDARWVAISAKEDQPQPEPVFNFRVADYHTYFVGDPSDGDTVLVHNEYEGRRSDVHIEGNIIFYDGTLGRPEWDEIMHLIIFRTDSGPRGFSANVLADFIFWPVQSSPDGTSEEVRRQIAQSQYDAAMQRYNQELLDYYHRIMRELVKVGDSIARAGFTDLPEPYCNNDYTTYGNKWIFFGLYSERQEGATEYFFPSFTWKTMSEMIQFADIRFPTIGGADGVRLVPNEVGGNNFPNVSGMRIGDASFYSEHPQDPIDILIHEAQHEFGQLGLDLDPILWEDHIHIRYYFASDTESKPDNVFSTYVNFLQSTMCGNKSLWDHILEEAGPRPTRPPRPSILDNE